MRYAPRLQVGFVAVKRGERILKIQA